MRAIGIDLGGTKMSFGVIDEKGTLSDKSRIETPDSWVAIRSQVVEKVSSFQSRYQDIVGVGFGVAGLIGNDGYVPYSPNVPAFDEGAHVLKDLQSFLDIEVFVDNDNNCAGLAEVIFGNAQGYKHVLSLGLGTGIGGAYIVDGALLRGAHGYAGELGHWTMDVDGPQCACGQLGCYESLASGSALGRIAKEYAEKSQAEKLIKRAGSIDEITSDIVGKAVIAREPDSLAIMNLWANNVARGMVSLTNIFDPDAIVISGGIVQMGDAMLDPIKDYYVSHIEGGNSRPMPFITLAALGENAGLIGAGVLALTGVTGVTGGSTSHSA